MTKPGPKPKIQDYEAPALLARYRAGESPADLATQFDVHRSTLLHFLHRHGLRPDEVQSGGYEQTSPEIEADILRRYFNLREGPKKMFDLYGVCKGTVHNIIKRSGCVVRAEKGVHFPSRADAFDALTPEASYWAGMLMADGCVTKTGQVILALQRDDEPHIRAFQAFIGAEQHKVSQVTVTDKRTGAVSLSSRLAVVNHAMCARLCALGVTVRKTYTAKASAELENSRDFWRGAADGDGCVHSACVHDMLGSKNLCEQYVAYLEKIIPGISYSFYPRPGCWCVAVHGPDARRWLKHLYQPNDIALGRKLARALHWSSGATAKLPLYE